MVEMYENNASLKLRKKRILILAPFFQVGSVWIDDFCGRSDFEFKKAPNLYRPGSWHERGPTTPVVEWSGYFKYAYQAMRWRADCIVTCFPQLAAVASVLIQYLNGPKTRLIAWNFNLGTLSSGWKRHLARRVLWRVDRFVVHSRAEIASYSQWLGIEEQKFQFVPLQRGRITGLKATPIEKPYIVSMGSANRDYRTLVDAVLGTGIKTVIISKKSIIESLPDHPDLVKLDGLTQEDCNSILGGAVLNVIPVATAQTASGQVTFTTAMRMGIPTIATRCVGTVDYIRDGRTGILVSPGDALGLRRAIECLWRDEGSRVQIGSAAHRYAEQHFSDEAAGRNFANIIDEVLGSSALAKT
jgi:glycosyltransferase involved in cell wall biosynthesis